MRFQFTFWQRSAIKEVPKCLGTTYKSKICQEPNNIFFCSFLCKFFSLLCGNYRRMKWAVALLVWEDKNYSPLLASYFQNEKLFCDILIHLGPHTSPKSCSIQIVFEQKYSFLHDVYLTNIWMMLLLHFFLMQLQIKLHILVILNHERFLLGTRTSCITAVCISNKQKT